MEKLSNDVNDPNSGICYAGNSRIRTKTSNGQASFFFDFFSKTFESYSWMFCMCLVVCDYCNVGEHALHYHGFWCTRLSFTMF